MAREGEGRDLLVTLSAWWLGSAAGAGVAGVVAWAVRLPGTLPGETPYGWVGFVVVVATAALVGAGLGGGLATGWWLARTGRVAAWPTAGGCVGIAGLLVGATTLLGVWPATPVVVLVAPLVARPVALRASTETSSDR